VRQFAIDEVLSVKRGTVGRCKNYNKMWKDLLKKMKKPDGAPDNRPAHMFAFRVRL